METEKMFVIEHRETRKRYLFDLINHSLIPYLNDYTLVTNTIPLKEKFSNLPIFNLIK